MTSPLKYSFAVSFEEVGPMFVVEPQGIPEELATVLPTKLMMKIAVGNEIPHKQLYGPTSQEDLSDCLLLYLPLVVRDPDAGDIRMRMGGKLVVVFLALMESYVPLILKKYAKVSNRLLEFFEGVEEFSQFMSRMDNFEEQAEAVIDNVLFELEIEELVTDPRVDTACVFDGTGTLLAEYRRTSALDVPETSDLFLAALMGSKLMAQSEGSDDRKDVDITLTMEGRKCHMFVSPDAMVAFVLNPMVVVQSGGAEIGQLCAGYAGKITSLLGSRVQTQSFRGLTEKLIPEAHLAVYITSLGMPIDHYASKKTDYGDIVRLAATASTLTHFFDARINKAACFAAGKQNAILHVVTEKKSVLVLFPKSSDISQMLPKVETLSAVLRDVEDKSRPREPTT